MANEGLITTLAATPPTTLGPIAAWIHTPKTPPVARVLLIHGLSEHSGRHLNTAASLLEEGYEVVRFDLRGAGQSGGRRQYVDRFEDYVDDTARVFNWIQSDRPPLPLFVLGHSLGGAIATHFTALYHNAIRGLVLSAPAYQVGSAISPMKIAVGRILVRFAPTFRLKGNSDNSAVSRDPVVVEAYGKDPLSSRTNTLQQGNEILRALDEMPERCLRIAIPVLIVHGTADRIIRLEGSFELLHKLASTDKELLIMPGGYHETHNDLDKEVYFSRLHQWLASHRVATDHPTTHRKNKSKTATTQSTGVF